VLFHEKNRVDGGSQVNRDRPFIISITIGRFPVKESNSRDFLILAINSPPRFSLLKAAVSSLTSSNPRKTLALIFSMADQTLDFLSLARFLQRLMNEEKGKSRGNLGRLAIAVHAVFVDYKFVLSSDCESLFTVQSQLSDLRYSIPNLEGPTAVIEFAVAGNTVTVSGYLSSDGDRSSVHRVCFDLLKLAAPLISSLHGAICDSQERAIVEFWKEVRSKLAVPLRIDICHKNDIFLPACFTCLPKVVKFRVLELVSAFDSAKIGCCCTELGLLCELDEIWKRRFEQKFGIVSLWRKKYALDWVKKRIEDGDYGELLSSVKIDELDGRISDFVPPSAIYQFLQAVGARERQ